MRWFASLFIIIYCALPLCAEEGPRLAVMEMTAAGDYPDAELCARLTDELRQRIANERLFAVLDGGPQQALLNALPDNDRFTDRRLCQEHGCLPELQRTLVARAALWIQVDCGPEACFVSATLTPIPDGRSTVILSETPRSEPGLRAALIAIAGRLGPPTEPPPVIAPAGAAPAGSTPLSAPDPGRGRFSDARPQLTYQNYVFILRAFAGASFGGGSTWGTLRWKNFQMEIAGSSVGAALDREGQLDAISFSCHLVGLGGKWALPSGGGHDELGFMIGVIGGGATLGGGMVRVELLPTRFMYRYNMDSGGVFEAGIALPLVWFGRDYTPNLTFYLGIGI